MDSVDHQIRTIEIFAGLSREDRNAVAGICQSAAFDVGTVIAREGLDARVLFALLDGTVGIWVDHGTASADLLAIREAPCLVGEMSVADELPRSASIVARTPVSGYTIDADAFRELLRERGSVALSLMKGISRLVRESNDSFISELRGRNKELTRTNRELKAAHRQLVRNERLSSLGKFSSMIIHDLRNPLSVIKGYADMLELKLGGEGAGSADLQRYASQIRRETARLAGLTNEWLDYSRGEIRLAYSPTNVAELFDQVKENVEGALEAKGIRVTWSSEFDGVALLDTERILRVLINIIDNARKACSRGGRIAVRAEKVDDRLKITVKDNGIGMDGETQNHVFDPFYSKSERGGTGLGMHIVSTVVKAHDGVIKLRSQPGKGSEVVLSLPMRL